MANRVRRMETGRVLPRSPYRKSHLWAGVLLLSKTHQAVHTEIKRSTFANVQMGGVWISWSVLRVCKNWGSCSFKKEGTLVWDESGERQVETGNFVSVVRMPCEECKNCRAVKKKVALLIYDSRNILLTWTVSQWEMLLSK